MNAQKTLSRSFRRFWSFTAPSVRRLLAAGAIGLWAAGSGQAQQVKFSLPFYEPFPTSVSAAAAAFNGFDYANNEELGQPVNETIGGFAACSSNVWSFGNSISSSCARIYGTNGVSGLQYPGLTNVDAAFQTGLMSIYPRDASSVKNRGAALAIPTNNPSAPMSLYASCLINIQTNSIGGATLPFPFFGLTANGAGGSVSQSGAVVYLNTAFQLQLSKNSTTASTNVTPALVASNTYLIVLRYKYNNTNTPSTNDQVDLWVDPIALGDVPVPPPTITITNNNNLASNFFGAVGIYESGLPPQIFIDEIRVATNWAGVTPAFPAPGAIYNVTGGGAGCAGDSFPAGLSGSDTGATYFLYTNGLPTGLSVDGTTGSPVSFGAQSTTAAYTVIGSNNITANVGWMAGNAIVSVLSPPSITTEPLPVVAVNGGLAVFSAASPSVGSGFHWFRNGTSLVDGGNISGSQTPDLVISPVGPGDAFPTAQGYYLVVTNQCGSPSYSTTNALTLGSPANIVWQGDGISNLWDAEISPNFTNGATPVVFNFGDNVIFDDTSFNPNVTLNSSYLSPSTITVNGSANTYVFGGPGALAGPGSILMNSTASLRLSTPNTETGGLVISNGVVNFDRASYLGRGPITLAGGQLASPNIGAVVITNVINVTGSNSAIGVNTTGGQNLTLTNILNGISGSLTVVNNSSRASSPAVILTYPSFSFNLPVDLNIGPFAGATVYLAGENTSGVQAWNGVISDSGQVERNGSGGTTLLNNTNTFTGNVLLVNGNLGVGASTLFVSPPTVPATILSGPLGTGSLLIATNAGTPALFASAGPQSVGNPIAFQLDVVIPAFIINGSQNLTLAGGMDLFGTNRTLEIDNTGDTTLSGIIFDSVNDAAIANALANLLPPPAPGALTKTGAGILYMDCVETNGLFDAAANPIVFGAINVNAGAISGAGTLGGPVVVAGGGAIGAGDRGQIGALTISNNLTLQGSANFRINKTGGVRTSDLIAGLSNVVYGGALVVTNTGTDALAVNDTFTLFSAATSSGNFTSITGGAANYTFNPGTGVLTVASLVATNPTNITFSVSGGNLSLSWPGDHLGWILQTNSSDVSKASNWFNYTGSALVTNETILVDQNKTNVFFRLIGP